MKARVAAALLVLAAAAPQAACTASGTARINVTTSSARPRSSPATTSAFGASQTVRTDTGTAKVTVGRPEVVTTHAATYNPHTTDFRSPAPTAASAVRVQVTVEGVAGQVPPFELPTTGIYLSYLVGGAEVRAQAAGSLFEDNKPLSVTARNVPVGGKASGYLYFPSADATGSVVATLVGPLDAPAVAVWQG